MRRILVRTAIALFVLAAGYFCLSRRSLAHSRTMSAITLGTAKTHDPLATQMRRLYKEALAASGDAAAAAFLRKAEGARQCLEYGATAKVKGIRARLIDFHLDGNAIRVAGVGSEEMTTAARTANGYEAVLKTVLIPGVGLATRKMSWNLHPSGAVVGEAYMAFEPFDRARSEASLESLRLAAVTPAYGETDDGLTETNSRSLGYVYCRF